jgi:hypothetical protein
MRTLALPAIAALAALCALPPAKAAQPADFIARFEREASQADANFKGFSANRGQSFFTSTHGADWSCSSCHTDRPVQPGKHAKTGKTISPLAPMADAQRFTSEAKVDKWFKRNCTDVLGRPCTAQEKGDVLTWLIGLRK